MPLETFFPLVMTLAVLCLLAPGVFGLGGNARRRLMQAGFAAVAAAILLALGLFVLGWG